MTLKQGDHGVACELDGRVMDPKEYEKVGSQKSMVKEHPVDLHGPSPGSKLSSCEILNRHFFGIFHVVQVSIWPLRDCPYRTESVTWTSQLTNLHVVIQPPRLAHIAYYRAGNYQPPATCFMYINIRTSHEIEQVFQSFQ